MAAFLAWHAVWVWYFPVIFAPWPVDIALPIRPPEPPSGLGLLGVAGLYWNAGVQLLEPDTWRR